MTESVNEPTAEPTNTPEQGNPAEESLGEAGKQALDRMKAERNEAVRSAKALEAKLQQFEDRDKTEAQKLTERAEAAERRATELERRAIRLEVAAEKGLTPAQAQRLVGETREQLESDADALLEMFKPADDVPPVVPSLDLGTPRSGTPMPLNGDPLEQALRKKLGIS